MYVREVEGEEITLRVSGKLWNRSLVMMDDETGSLWSHLLGQCMSGKHKDKTLTTIPSVIVDWESWKTDHPQTDVVMLPTPPNPRLAYDTKFYQTRPEEHFLIGMVEGTKSKAYSFAQLYKQQVINDQFAGHSLVLSFDSRSGAAWAYERTVDDQLLEFVLEGRDIIDSQTRSRWDLRRGVALDGDLKGKKLDPIVVIPSFAEAWRTFHPDSEYWTAPE